MLLDKHETGQNPLMIGQLESIMEYVLALNVQLIIHFIHNYSCKYALLSNVKNIPDLTQNWASYESLESLVFGEWTVIPHN